MVSSGNVHPLLFNCVTVTNYLFDLIDLKSTCADIRKEMRLRLKASKPSLVWFEPGSKCFPRAVPLAVWENKLVKEPLNEQNFN